jgi:DNA-binding transcriptional ArsR family regulator
MKGTDVKKFKILSDPCRLKILKLVRESPLPVNEIVDLLKIERTLACHHLKVLRQAEMITARKVGRNVFYETSAKIIKGCGENTFDFQCCTVHFDSQAADERSGN